MDYENNEEDSEITSSQEGDDSVNNEEPESQTEQTEEEQATAPETTEADTEDVKISDYRPKKAEVTPETAKIIAQRKEIQRLKEEMKAIKEESLQTNDDSFEELANDLGVTVEAVKKMQKVLVGKNTEVEEKLNLILAEKQRSESDKNFNADFDKWAKGNPERESKRAFFKKIAFDAEFTHLETLGDIEKHFFPSAPKKKTIEGGTTAKTGGSERIDFANMTEDQRERLYSNPKKQKEYFEWLDSQN